MHGILFYSFQFTLEFLFYCLFNILMLLSFPAVFMWIVHAAGRGIIISTVFLTLYVNVYVKVLRETNILGPSLLNLPSAPFALFSQEKMMNEPTWPDMDRKDFWPKLLCQNDPKLRFLTVLKSTGFLSFHKFISIFL